MKQFVQPVSTASGPELSMPNAVTVAPSKYEVSLFRETKRPSRQVDMVELVRLYHTIEQGIGRGAGSMLLLVGATAAEHTADTLHGLAWAGASLLGKRVLFVDLTDAGAGQSSGSVSAHDGAIGTDLLRGQALIEQSISQGLEAGLYVASIPYDATGGSSTAFPQLQSFLHNLRPAFDLILVASPPALDSPIAGALCGFADGSILLVESGKSRYRSVARAIDILSSARAAFLGVVLANRTDPRPRWVRKWFWT